MLECAVTLLKTVGHLFGGTMALQIFAEHLLNIRLQMGCFGATEEPVTLTKHMKIGLCEQVRVN
jgi:hypothetical protein